MRALGLVLAVTAIVASAGCGENRARIYDVMVENLMRGQPLAPPVTALHGEAVSLFRIGSPSGRGLAKLAREGDGGVLLDELAATPGVGAALEMDGPIAPAGRAGATRRMIRLATAEEGVDRISVAAMLICTNDGFAAADGVQLPTGVEVVEAGLVVYDAGVEANDELSASLDDRCPGVSPIGEAADGNGGRETDEPVLPHPGIQGVGNLSPDLHGWGEFVGRVVIQRHGIWK